MKKYLILLPMMAALVPAYAGEKQDTLKTELLQEAVVKAVRAPKDAPFTVTEISPLELNSFSRTGKEMPFLLSRTPGVLAWSENGLGTGTSYMRIRGAGDSRINVTLDGLPLNSPEDQCVFWANMNSYASLLGNVQVQRGVGTSTSGDGAFGGAISLSTKSPNMQRFIELTGSYGAYGTAHFGASASSGLLLGHLVLEAAYNGTTTDGYMHGTDGSSGSWTASASWLADKYQLRFRVLGNYECTGQAWNGIEVDGVGSYADIVKMGLGRYNSLVESYEIDADGNVSFKPYSLNDGSIWKSTDDNFKQTHYILSSAFELGKGWKSSLSLRYSGGYGFYEEFRPNNKLAKFGIGKFTLKDGSTLKKTDFIRKKGLSQDVAGAAANVSYESERVNFIAGANLQSFKGNHFGYLSYISNAELASWLLADGKHLYYDSDATKNDISAYAKADFHLGCGWDVFADLQYRSVAYATDGYNDKFYSEADEANPGFLKKQTLNIDETYNFFNPKAGVSYRNGGHRAYASVARSNREPERNNFTDNGNNPYPKPESLTDYELGYEYEGARFHAGATLYYMDYRNQFVQNGQISDIGEALTVNIRSSYRTGVELVAGADLLPWLSLDGNLALSRNRLRDFDEYVSTYDSSWNELSPTLVHHADKALAFSPSVIANAFANFRFGDFRASWHTGYVGRMFLDNTECVERSLPAYSVSNLNANYVFNIGKAVKSITLGAEIGNIFNRHYAASGYAWSSIVGDEYPESNRYYGIGFIPQAGITAMLSLSFRF